MHACKFKLKDGQPADKVLTNYIFQHETQNNNHSNNKTKTNVTRVVKGKPIPQFKVQQPKNGVRGPRPQNPQMCGALPACPFKSSI